MKPEAARSRHQGWMYPMVCVASCTLLVLFSARPSAAQLRPLEPIVWRGLDASAHTHGGIGIGILNDQRASLAGTRGTLLEIGNWFVTYRSDRIALEFAGTAVRRFEDGEVLDAPFARTDPPDGEARMDAGDVRLATIIRLFGDVDRSVLAVRFGTRLPTTSDEPGLDRDRTDFFGTAAARHRLARGIRVFAEAGVGINSTILDSYPQSDVLVYSAGVEAARRRGRAGLRLQVIGQDDLHRRVIRGNEDLAELRLGAWLGGRSWIEAEIVRGLAEFSPSWGVLLEGGMTLW